VRNGIIDLRYWIDAEDVARALVYSLPFRHAFSIIAEVGLINVASGSDPI